MTLWADGIGSGDLGAAVAAALVADVRNDRTGLDGFPQIDVERVGIDEFQVRLRMGETLGEPFSLSKSEAGAAIRSFKTSKAVPGPLFEKARNALAHLDIAVRKL